MSNNFVINPNDSFNKLMYLIKEKLKENHDLDLIANIDGSLSASRVAEILSRLNYVKISNIYTTTKLIDNFRKINLIIKITKSSEFNKLYLENEEKRKQYTTQHEY